MKKIFLAVMLLSFTCATTVYGGGGKKKAKAKAKKECCDKACNKDKKCDPAACYIKPVCNK